MLRYLFLLFSPDSVLPLDRFVLSTEALKKASRPTLLAGPWEAHPVPMMRAMSSLGVEWPCQAGLRAQAAQAPQLLGLWSLTAFGVLCCPRAQSPELSPCRGKVTIAFRTDDGGAARSLSDTLAVVAFPSGSKW